VPFPHEPGPHWGEVGIHGLHRQREWDRVTTVDLELAGDEVWLVVLASGRVLVEDGPPELDGGPFAQLGLERPYRVRAVRQGPATWVAAARRIEVAELDPDPGGDEIELSLDRTGRTVRVDGSPTLSTVPQLERLGARRGASYVVRARRLEGRFWEVEVAVL
jgi:hypothetical protein